jgi:hypothetical protein
MFELDESDLALRVLAALGVVIAGEAVAGFSDDGPHGFDC